MGELIHMMNEYPLLEMEYSPSILDEKEIGTLDKVPLATISAFGGSLATLPTSLRTITETVTTSGDGLYKAVFPEGVVGKMDGLIIGRNIPSFFIYTKSLSSLETQKNHEILHFSTKILQYSTFL